MLLVKEIKILLASVAFLTRIPVPLKKYEIDGLQKDTPRYYPYAGMIVGATGAAVYLLSRRILSQEISVFLSMAATMFITGAFHEDGLMDFADGFGGGYERSDILRIMKDPRAGSYGVITIVTFLILKYLVLTEVNSAGMPFVLVFSHSLSRFFSISLLPWMDYARTQGKSSFIEGRMSYGHLVFALLGGMAPVFIFQNYAHGVVFIVLLFSTFAFAFYIKSKIGGYTGDCLGALQQISEIIICMSFLIINGTAAL